MPDEQRTLTANFTANSSGFAKGTTEAIQQLLELNTSLQQTKNAIKETNDQIKTYQKELAQLKQATDNGEKATDEQRARMQELEDAIAQCNAQMGVHRTAQQQLQKEIRTTNKQLSEQKSETKETSNAIREIYNRLIEQKAATSDLSTETSRFGDILKASLVSSAIQNALQQTIQLLKSAARYSYEVGSSFEAGMSQVGAISNASAAELTALTEKAKEMGASTKFTATEAAEALNYMAMAGWKTEDMLSGIDGVINLAAASGENLGTVSDIVTDALTAFGLSAKDSAHFADVLAAASANSNTNVAMMGETFTYAASIAGSLGYSIEDTATAIGIMANSGIKASQAGTALRTIMTNLSGEVKIAGESIGEVVIATSNADGSMKEFSEILGEVRKAFAGLTEAEKANAAESLVGKYAMSGFLSLMNATEDDVNKLTMAIQNCDGATSSMAETMQDNVKGSVTIAQSALEGLGISVYEQFGDGLRGAIETFTDGINEIAEDIDFGAIENGAENLTDSLSRLAEKSTDLLSENLPGMIDGLANIVSFAMNGADGIATLTTGIVTLTAAQKVFNLIANANPYVLVITAAVTAVSFLIPKMVELYEATDLCNDEYNELNEKTKELTQAAEDYKAAASGVDDIAEEYSRITEEVTDLTERETALRDLQDDLIDQYGIQASGIDLVNGSYQEQLTLLQNLKTANEELYQSTIQSRYDTAMLAQDAVYTLDTHIKDELLGNVLNKWIYENLKTSSYSEYTGSYEELASGSVFGFDALNFSGSYADRAADLKALYDYAGTLIGQGGGIYDDQLKQFRASLSAGWAEMEKHDSELQSYAEALGLVYHNPSTTHSSAEYYEESGKAYLAAQQARAAQIKEESDKAYEELKAEYDKEKQLADDMYNVGEISQEEHYNRLTALRDAYLDKSLNSHDWYTATSEILKLTDQIGDAAEKTADRISASMDGVKQTYQELMAAIDAEFERRNRDKQDAELQAKINSVTAQLAYDSLDEYSRRSLERELAELKAEKEDILFERDITDRKAQAQAAYEAIEQNLGQVPVGFDPNAWQDMVNMAFTQIAEGYTPGASTKDQQEAAKVYNIVINANGQDPKKVIEAVQKAIATGEI